MRDLADRYGFPVVGTERADHGIELTEAAAADGVDRLEFGVRPGAHRVCVGAAYAG